MIVEFGISFVINNSKANAADLRLKIGVFAVACFCFTKVSFSQFFSYYFIVAFFIHQQNSFSSTKVTSSRFKSLSYLYMTNNTILSCLYSC